MELCSPNGSVLQPYPSDAFAFPPVSETVGTAKSFELSDATCDSERTGLGNAPQDFEIHNPGDLAWVRTSRRIGRLQVKSKCRMA